MSPTNNQTCASSLQSHKLLPVNNVIYETRQQIFLHFKHALAKKQTLYLQYGKHLHRISDFKLPRHDRLQPPVSSSTQLVQQQFYLCTYIY